MNTDVIITLIIAAIFVILLLVLYGIGALHNIGTLGRILTIVGTITALYGELMT